MKSFSEEKILEGIIKHDSEVFIYIYNNYYSAIESFVIHNNGTIEQAEDVFQEGLLIAYRKLKEEKLSLSCKFSTYLYSVCKKIFIQEKKKINLQQEKLKQQLLTIEDSGPFENPADQPAFLDLLQKHLSSLSPDCQKILKLTINNCTVEEIRTALQYNSHHHTADRRYRCKKSLIKKIVADPLFKKLIDEIC